MSTSKPSQYVIEFKTAPNPVELKALFFQTSWAKDRSLEDIEVLIRNLDVYVSILHENQLIGFGRATTDTIYRALIDDVIVDENYRTKGIGKIIMQSLLDQLKGVEEIFLNTREGLQSYYEQFGFEKVKIVTMNKKQEKEDS